MEKSQLDGIADLNQFKQKGLYGVGPVDQLKGEVTIYNGVPYISKIDRGRKPIVKESWNEKAIFLVYGFSKNWQRIEIEKDLIGLKEIELYVKEKASKSGLDINKPFPFRIEGQSSKMVYHIIYLTQDDWNNSGSHAHMKHHHGKRHHQNHKDKSKHKKSHNHQKAKKKFNLKDFSLNIVGFWSSADGEGVYTHPGKRTHLNFVSEDKNHSGHVDDIKLNKDSVLFIPAI